MQFPPYTANIPLLTTKKLDVEVGDKSPCS